MSKIEDELFQAFMRVRQFARYSTGRLLGTVAASRGSYRFVMDLLEKATYLRIEVNAISKLLIDKGVMTEKEWGETLLDEVQHFEREMQKQWPEVTVQQDGGGYTLDVQGAVKRCHEEQWPP